MSKTILAGAWRDIDLTTAEPASIKRPINIQRTMLDKPAKVIEFDKFFVTLSYIDEHGRCNCRNDTPTFLIKKAMVIDSITKFEVIDEFGVDVGIGFVLGQAKRS